VQRLRNPAVRNWNAYRAWHRACLRSAWRETRVHFSSGWRSAREILAPGVAATLVTHVLGSADPIVSIATGAAVSVLWIIMVFCWNFGLAPYRLWRAALARMAKLGVARRIDPRIIRRELELCIRQGQTLMDAKNPPKGQLTAWYERVLRAVSRAGHDDRALLESLGPAPGTRGGPLELLILSNRIEKLRVILDRQPSSRESEGITSVGQRRVAGA
jgi:hypothetical protein